MNLLVLLKEPLKEQLEVLLFIPILVYYFFKLRSVYDLKKVLCVCFLIVLLAGTNSFINVKGQKEERLIN